LQKRKVLKAFRDKYTFEYYSVGDFFVSEDIERVAYLCEKGFLEKIKINIEEPTHLGGGYYELFNGEKIRGKEKAYQRWGELNV